MAAKGRMPKVQASIEALAGLLGAGERVYLPGSTGEPPGLTEALFHPGARPLQITSTYLPGVNAMPVGSFPRATVATSIFAATSVASAQADGRIRHLPMSYGALVRHLRDDLTFDSCIVHVSPPNVDGLCSLGPAVECTPLALPKSKRVLAVINRRMPRLPHGVNLAITSFAAVAEIDAPLRTYEIGTPSVEADTIAAHIAAFVDDCATVQIGLGKVPDALMAKLVDRRRLKLFSGMLSDGARVLAESGSLDPDFAHTCCVQLGSHAYYEWLCDRPDFVMAGSEITHSVPVIAQQPRLVAVNSALSVDLFGQANLEMLGGRAISGCGGAPDFARGAALSEGGISIIALPSTGGRDQSSRIVPALDGIASVSRNDIHVVVTEYGAADLRGRSVIERGDRLIGIAAPQHRPMLTDAWHQIARKL